MALTRKFMQGMGLTEEQASAIIEANEETITGLKAEIEKYKTASEDSDKKLAKVQKELDTMKEEAETNDSKNPYKAKYEAIKEEFETFKTDISAKETKANKKEAYKALLKECGVSDKRIDTVLRCSDSVIESLELEDGNIKGTDDLKKSIADEWADFIPTEGAKGAETSTPPGNVGGSKLTKQEIMKIKNDSERQKAWAEYLSQNR